MEETKKNVWYDIAEVDSRSPRNQKYKPYTRHIDSYI